MSQEILSNAQMRAADAAAIASGVPGIDLMRAAGGACADALTQRWRDRRVVVACGPGNNGGDGFIMAARLADKGADVSLGLLGSKDTLAGDAALASGEWRGDIHALEALDIGPEDVFIDALFGTGLSRPIEGDAAALAARVNAARPRTLAVDLPSGLNGDTGRAPDICITADLTVTFARKKFAHVLEPAASLCGEIVVADIGIPSRIIAGLDVKTQENEPSLWRSHIPWPSAASHKYRRGGLVVITGGVGQTGAARLAARAGLRVGAGLSTLLTPPSALLVAAASSTSVMTKSTPDVKALLDAIQKASAAVIGPGTGVSDRTRSFVEALLSTRLPCVLDADALTVFESSPSALFERLHGGCLLTPHTGEFGRLFPGLLEASETRVIAAQRAAELSGAVTVLKGADTVIAAPNGQAAINRHASPFLATAGSGDVLAGLVGGFLAQGVSAFDAACAAAWVHGDASLRLGPGLIAEDLTEVLPDCLAALYSKSRPEKR